MFPQFHLYGLILGSAIAVSYWRVELMIKKEKISQNIDLAALWTIVFGIIGARIYHLITDWSLYADASIWQLLQIWNGGLGVIGAVIGGLVGLWIGLFIQRKNQEWWKIVDILAINVPLGQAIGRWGNYINHELFGLPTSLPWGIFIPFESRPKTYAEFTQFHPLFLYESLLMLGVFIFLQLQQNARKWQIGSKKFVGAYFMLYASIRFCLEFLRVETARGGGVFSVISVASWMMVGLFMLGATLFIDKKNFPFKQNR